MTKQRIAIIGGGMTGLSAAYYLSKDKRFDVTLYERNDTFGGLLGILEVNGAGLEGFYHHLFKRDSAIIDLTKELGLEDKLVYLPSKIGIFYKRKIYPFSSPIDLIRFSPLSIVDRIRLGLVALYLQRFVSEKSWKKLRSIPAGKWMKTYAGEKAYNVIWKPLLEGKFGSSANKISMAWLWSRLYLRGRSRNKKGKEELVYLNGGFKVLIDKMVKKIRENGGTLYLNTRIQKIEQNKIQTNSSATAIHITVADEKKHKVYKSSFDKCIVTIPNPIFVRITPSLSKKIKDRLLKVKYRGAMVAVLQLKKKFMQKIYWLNIHELDMNLLAVVEHTNFVDPQFYDGKHILYAGNYPAQDNPIMSMAKEKLINLITEELKNINSDFSREWVEKYWIFRNRFAQPIVTTNYHTYIPPIETGIKNLYLVNMAQVYPEDRGTNQAVRDGKKIAQKIISGEL